MRFGIVGSGGMGETWAEVAANWVDGGRVAAIWGGHQATALAERYVAAAAPSLAALLARDDIDTIIVATPLETHAEFAIAAARAGKHVFVEKPMAATVAEADAMIRAADQAGVALGVVSQHRFRPTPLATRDAIAAGAIGRVRMVEVQGAVPWPTYRRDRAPWFELGAHLCDLLRWLIDSEPVDVSARFTTFGDPSEHAQTGLATYHFASGALARVWMTFELPSPGIGSQVEFLIVGSDGIIELDSYSHARLLTADGPRLLAEQPEGDPANPFDPARLESYAGQLRDFVAAVRDGVAPGVDGWAGRTTIAMLEAALRSDAERRTVEIAHEPVPPESVAAYPGPSARTYAGLVLPRLERIAREQLAPIDRAGELVADALAGGGRIWVTQTSHYLHHEATHRAGGLLAVHALESPEAVRRGDVVLLGITAGAAADIVDLALDVQGRGACVVAISQLDFERHPDLPATHPSGRRLGDVADVHVDIGGPYGDGELELGATGIRVLPSSGVASLLVLWMVFAEAVGRLLDDNLVPLAYESNLLPGAPERNLEREALYASTGRGVTAVPIAEPSR